MRSKRYPRYATVEALASETRIHAEHSKESVEKAEEAHRAIWDALRRKLDKRE